MRSASISRILEPSPQGLSSSTFNLKNKLLYMTHFASDFFYYFFKTYLIIGPFFYLFTHLNQIKSTTYIVSLQTKQTNIVVNFLLLLQQFEELHRQQFSSEVDSWGTFGAKNSVDGFHLYLEKEKKIIVGPEW